MDPANPESVDPVVDPEFFRADLIGTGSWHLTTPKWNDQNWVDSVDSITRRMDRWAMPLRRRCETRMELSYRRRRERKLRWNWSRQKKIHRKRIHRRMRWIAVGCGDEWRKGRLLLLPDHPGNVRTSAGRILLLLLLPILPASWSWSCFHCCNVLTKTNPAIIKFIIIIIIISLLWTFLMDVSPATTHPSGHWGIPEESQKWEIRSNP